MTTRQIPAGSMSKLNAALPETPTMKAPTMPNAPVTTDLMELINTAAPGKDGLGLLYSLAGGLEFRIARLAAMTTNVMAASLLARSIASADDTSIGKMNEAINALDEIKNRAWAFDQAGIAQTNMLDDLKALVNFNTTVQTKVKMLKSPSITPKLPTEADRVAAHARWIEVITLAAEPRAVEEWKYELSWAEYLEGCKGKAEMTEEEHRILESINLAGKKNDWATYASQIIGTIESCEDEPIEFGDLSTRTQAALLKSISSEDKEAKFRKGALKMAKDPADLHTRRQFISSFMVLARQALDQPCYADPEDGYAEVAADPDASAERSSNRIRATLQQQSLDNADAFEYQPA
jgi:hypothetical protein